MTGIGLALPAGLNAYIPLMAVAIADRYFGLVHLSEPYDAISSPGGILIIGILLFVELLADKIPIVDSVNDLINSVIRPAAGAVLVMAATDTVTFVNPVAAMFVGLLVAGGIHTAKAGIRPTITATTGGIGNPVVSAFEDGIAIGLVILAIIAPIIVAVVLVFLVLVSALLFRERHRRKRLEAMISV